MMRIVSIRKQEISTFLFMLLLLPVMVLHAEERSESRVEKGLNIALETARRDSGWHDSSSQLTMILLNKHGDKRERKLTSKALEVEGDGDKRLVTFEYPPDVRGTAFLTFTHKNSDDDQWIYIPSLKRIKRIATSNKSGSFMGSEFAYEDIAGQEVEKFTYRWLRDEAYEGSMCFVVESTPVDLKNSGYIRRVSWIDKNHYFAHRINYFDKHNRHFKTLNFRGYKQYEGKYWRPGLMEMLNHEHERTTQIIWQDYKFKLGLENKDFTKRALKH